MSDDRLVVFAERVAQLSDLPRTGWLFCGVQGAESVADHSFGVVAISVWIAELLEADIASVAKIAILHDLSEAVVTDIPGPVKGQLPGVRQQETEIGRRLADEAYEGWSVWIDAYDEQKTLESQIVKAADFLQMVLQARRYDRFGNGDVSSFMALEPPGFEDDRLNEIISSIVGVRSI